MKRKEVLFFITSAIVLLGVFHLLFGRFFPNAHGTLGHDYALFLPKLLDGYFWYHTNGLLAVEWFTPAFCGGIPLLPDPQSIYYSVPQFLSFITDPLHAVYLTVLGFAVLGFAGFYLLLRQAFSATPSAALLASGLFLFNGFYIHRMIIGHLTYHPFMLVPLIAFVTLRHVSETARRQLTLDGILAGILIAYMFQAGMVNVILPAMGSVVVIGLVHGIISRHSRAFWLRLSLGGGLACVLSLAKLTAAIAYLHQFGRDTYRLPGAGSLVQVAVLAFRSLFVAPAHDMAREVLVNVQWLLERHEFEFGVTFVPLGILLMAAVSALRRKTVPAAAYRLHRGQWLRLAAIAALFCLPLLLNYYTPAWNAFLKQVPILKNSTSLLRWFCMYIPAVILLSALAVDHTPMLRAYRGYVAAGGMLIVIALNLATNRDYYQAQPYDPNEVVAAFRRVQRGDWAPKIENIAVFVDGKGQASMPPGRNNVLIRGSSQLLCYEPLFGYRLEQFPLKTLRPGPVLARRNGHLNLKNPACYVFPEANRCAPGDHFSAVQYPAADAFVRYRPFRFALPIWQKAADVLNLLAVAGVTAYLVVYIPIGWLLGKRDHDG